MHSLARHCVHSLDDLFWQALQKGRSVVRLREIAVQLFPEADIETAEKAVTALLQLCARARSEPDSLPVIPHKLHLQVRAPGHFSVCLNSACTGDRRRFVDGAGILIPDLATICPECRSATLTLAICRRCSEWLLAGTLHDDQLRLRSRWVPRLESEEEESKNDGNAFYRPAAPSRPMGCQWTSTPAQFSRVMDEQLLWWNSISAQTARQGLISSRRCNCPIR